METNLLKPTYALIEPSPISSRSKAMASWNNGFLIAQDKVNICVGNFGKHNYRIISVPNPLLFNYSPRRAQGRFLCCNKSKSVVNDKIHLETQLVREKKTHPPRRRFSLRLRPRIRLFSRKLKRGSIKSLLDSIGAFVRKNVKRIALSTCLFLVLGLCFWFLRITATLYPKEAPYSHLITSLQSGSVSSVSFEEGTRRIYYNSQSWRGRDVDDDVARENVGEQSKRPLGAWEFSTVKIDQDMGYLLGLIRERGALYGSAPQSPLVAVRGMLVTVLVLWIPLSPLVWLLYRQLNAANGPTKKRKTSKRLVCFEDVEGVDTAKVELMEIVCCLQGSINYSKLGAKLPRGVLLVGPPGTGKTLLARAVAGEAGVPFFSVSASEFVEMFVGRGAARIRELFEVARKNAPSIVFIDELDAVGGRRGRSFNDERDQTLNQLLTEMDGFDSEINVVVIAATNRPESLDSALCRPGRFSRKVYVGQPDEDGRRKILAIHMRGVPLEEDVGLMCNLVASLTQGLVGADLANIVNEAALLAARRGSGSVSREDVMEAVERSKFGINGKRESGPSAITKKLEKLFPWMPWDARPSGLSNIKLTSCHGQHETVTI